MDTDRKVTNIQILFGDERRYKSMPLSQVMVDYLLWSVPCREGQIIYVKTQPRGVKHLDAERSYRAWKNRTPAGLVERKEWLNSHPAELWKSKQADSMDFVQGFHLSKDVKEPLLCARLSEILEENKWRSEPLSSFYRVRKAKQLTSSSILHIINGTGTAEEKWRAHFVSTLVCP